MGTEATLYKILPFRYKQFGGPRVVRIYAKMGAFWPMVKQIMRNPFSRHSYKRAYTIAIRRVEPFLREKYAPMMVERKVYYQKQSLVHVRSNKVWFCWLQGIEQAPVVIRTCYHSIMQNLADWDVRLIDETNWRNYVDLPDYIIKRWEKKQIPPAHFTDLIRLQLLIRYGGTWIDSTILCTGFTPQNEQYTKSYLDADLFMFQYTRPGSIQWGGIGNWFITACTNNEVLMVLRDMLFAYWKDYDCIIDYYIFHLFFSMLREVFPKEIAAMPYGYCIPSLTLVHHWEEQFDKEKWEQFTSKVCFHKVTYLIKQSILNDKVNYYHYIINKFLTDK